MVRLQYRGVGKCNICGRILTDPQSVQRGIGPECWEVYQARLAQEDAGNEGQDGRCKHHRWVGDFAGDVVLGRDEKGYVTANIPQKVVKHSPTGFEFGYGGSGPADLALNILLCYTDGNTAQEWYQDFKWAFVAKLPEAGGVIKGDDVRKWLAAQKADLFSQAA